MTIPSYFFCVDSNLTCCSVLSVYTLHLCSRASSLRCAYCVGSYPVRARKHVFLRCSQGRGIFRSIVIFLWYQILLHYIVATAPALSTMNGWMGCFVLAVGLHQHSAYPCRLQSI